MFGTLKDRSLQFNFIKQLFQLQKSFPKWRQRFVKNGFKNPVFLVEKLKISCSFRQISLACGTNIFKECIERL